MTSSVSADMNISFTPMKSLFHFVWRIKDAHVIQIYWNAPLFRCYAYLSLPLCEYDAHIITYPLEYENTSHFIVLFRKKMSELRFHFHS